MTRTPPPAPAVSPQGVLRELRSRLAEKAPLLDEMAEHEQHDLRRKSRLFGKSDGVRLAVSFIDETLRDLDR